MVQINKCYYNKNRHVDRVIVENIEYDDGIKKIYFRRYGRDTTHALPIEMFDKNFIEIVGEHGPT